MTTAPRPDQTRARNHGLSGSQCDFAVATSGVRRSRESTGNWRQRVVRPYSTLVGARATDVIFTSGGTEANALAIFGAIQGAAEAGERITRLFVTAIEHDSVLASASALAERSAGLRLDFIAVDGNGVVVLDDLRHKLCAGKGRSLVAVMAANNETGVIQPLDELAAIVRETGCLLHVDAVQAGGKTMVSFIEAGAAYLSLSAHKMGGPPGVGALVVREDAPMAGQIFGGAQERGRRAGTENVSGIAGFGAAARSAREGADEGDRIQRLRVRFESELRGIAHDSIIFGLAAPRLGNTSNFAVPGIAADTALMALDLDGVMVSSGAACSSGKVRPSHVLAAMDVSEEVARCALRVSFGWDSIDDDVDAVIASLSKLRARVRTRAAA